MYWVYSYQLQLDGKLSIFLWVFKRIHSFIIWLEVPQCGCLKIKWTKFDIGREFHSLVSAGINNVHILYIPGIYPWTFNTLKAFPNISFLSGGIKFFMGQILCVLLYKMLAVWNLKKAWDSVTLIQEFTL